MTTEENPSVEADEGTEASESKPAAKKKATKKKATRKASVDTSTLVLEKKLVGDTAEVVERRNRVEQLLESAEQGKDKVKSDIYERVTSDYRVQLEEIAQEYAPLREQVIGELQRIREEETGLRSELAKLNEYLEEIRFRCQVGEFGEDELARLEEEKEGPGHELETKLEAVERTFKTAEDLLGEDVEAAISGDAEAEPEPEPEVEAEPEAEPEPEPEDEPEAAADAPVPDGTVMMSTSELPAVPDGPVPDGTVMMTDSNVPPAIPDGQVPDGTVMMGTADLPAVPDGPVPDGTVMMSEANMPPVPDGPVPDGTVMMSSDGPGDTDNMPRALLTRTKPEGEKVFVIDLEELTLGRSTTNDVVIEGASVSRRHATIKFEDGVYVIRDHSSGGGVLVNGERQTELALSTGDEITIGSSVFSFQGP
ncbi:MAG: FHA domain-containing protein [Acidobacteriota bacterium]